MYDWLKMLPKVPEIAENFIEHWRKRNTPRSQGCLALGKETLEKCLKHYFLLRDKRIRPKAINRIIARALELSNDIDLSIEQALDEWYNEEDKDWSPPFPLQTYAYDIEWCLESSWSWGYQIEIPKKPVGKKGRPKRDYPVKEILELRKQGLSIREIAKQKGLPYSAVQRTLKKHK